MWFQSLHPCAIASLCPSDLTQDCKGTEMQSEGDTPDVFSHPQGS